MIHHVQLACPAGSEDALRDFYSGVLDFQEVAKPPALAARGGCWFRGHGIELHLGVEHEFRPARKAHPGLPSMTWTPGPVGFALQAPPSSSMKPCPVCAASTVRTRTATGWNSSNLSTSPDPASSSGRRPGGPAG
jgi:catechol 2,3-dioxygenase-like lactoylglutathione lyase family enzyme